MCFLDVDKKRPLTFFFVFSFFIPIPSYLSLNENEQERKKSDRKTINFLFWVYKYTAV